MLYALENTTRMLQSQSFFESVNSVVLAEQSTSQEWETATWEERAGEKERSPDPVEKKASRKKWINKHKIMSRKCRTFCGSQLQKWTSLLPFRKRHESRDPRTAQERNCSVDDGEILSHCCNKKTSVRWQMMEPRNLILRLVQLKTCAAIYGTGCGRVAIAYRCLLHMSHIRRQVQYTSLGRFSSGGKMRKEAIIVRHGKKSSLKAFGNGHDLQ